jgi:hypothetical protein
MAHGNGAFHNVVRMQDKGQRVAVQYATVLAEQRTYLTKPG